MQPAVPTYGGDPKAGYQLGWCIWDALLKPLISSELWEKAVIDTYNFLDPVF